MVSSPRCLKGVFHGSHFGFFPDLTAWLSGFGFLTTAFQRRDLGYLVSIVSRSVR